MKKQYTKPNILIVQIQHQGDLLLNSWDSKNSDNSMDDPTKDMGIIRQDQGQDGNTNKWGYDPWNSDNW